MSNVLNFFILKQKNKRYFNNMIFDLISYLIYNFYVSEYKERRTLKFVGLVKK